MSRADSSVLQELTERAQKPETVWTPFATGIEIHRLWGEPPGESAALLRYAPGAEVGRHLHEGTEHIHVLSGSQRDDNGSYEAGAYVVNPPGSVHAVESPDGCVVFIVWERPPTFLDS